MQDWDISNSMIAMTTQLASKLGFALELRDAELTTWNRYASDPAGVRDMLSRTFGPQAKGVALKVANGGALSQRSDPEVLVLLTQLSWDRE